MPEASAMQRVSGFLRRRGVLIAVVLIVWFIISMFLKGVNTLAIPTSENTPFTSALREAAASIRGNRTESPAFVYFFNPIRTFVEAFIDVIRSIISLPSGDDIIPVVGWLGVVAIIGFVVFATSNWRTSLLAMVLMFLCGVLGMWTFTMDTLALTIGAVVLSLIIGLPLGVWAGLSDRVLAFLRPGLDLAQILPTLVYLAPLALFFLIGTAAATIATMIYSIPIAIRITSHAIRSLNAGPIEAATSMGSTRWQLLSKVQLPMAKRTIALGVNQTMMAALSFVVIAALIGAPGLGKPVVEALIIRDVGDGVVAGLAVVFLAIMLDRATTAAVVRTGNFVHESGAALIRRRIALGAAFIAMLVAIVLSRYELWAAVFPEQFVIGESIAAAMSAAAEWVTTNVAFLTTGFREVVTIGFLNPLESLLANTPWYVTIIAISLIAALIGGKKAAGIALILLGLIVLTGLWNDTMVTLAQVLIATVIVMVVGVVVGVLVGRNERFERLMKPILDAGQTLPAFVYLVPVLALFGPTRFAAIACGFFYAAPIVVRVVADGVRDVPSSMVEAATAAGSTRMQIITKVQLPASKRSLMLGANQGLIFVLAVVVIGGFVGAGGLGYLVIVGQSKPELQGKSLAAGLAILLLGVVLDRMAQAGADRRDKQATT